MESHGYINYYDIQWKVMDDSEDNIDLAWGIKSKCEDTKSKNFAVYGQCCFTPAEYYDPKKCRYCFLSA